MYNRKIRLPLLTTLFIIAALHVNAQSGGNVAIHSDPRLAVLLNRSKSAEQPDDHPSQKYQDKKQGSKKQQVKTAAADQQTPRYLYEADNEASVIAEKIKEIRKAGPAPVTAKATDTQIPATARSSATEKPADKKIAKDIPHEEHHAVKGVSGGPRYEGKGFRVQIYYGPNRQEALKRKAEFMHNYPGVATYLSFVSPHYRVKVGDFRKRDDALGMLKEANGTYSPCMIVPDEISIGKN